MKHLLIIACLILSACGTAPQGPASLQIVPPSFYSRTLHYTVREKHRGRTISRTYDIPVTVYRETGEIELQKDPPPEVRQMEVIQDRLDQIKQRLQDRKQQLDR